MRTLLLCAFTIFNFPSYANGILVEEADPIMSESLTRQGVPAPPFTEPEMRQAQEESQKQDKKQEQEQMVEVPQEEIQKLRKQIQALQRQVDNLKTKQRAQEQRSQEASKETKEQRQATKKVTRISIDQGLRNAEKVGEFGRYGIMAGTTKAKAWKLGETANEREVPALQVCSTLADVNRMSAQDFVFMGFEPAVAKEIIEARELLGEFSSSKQITAVEGVEPETYQALRQSIIAVDLKERLAE